MIFRGFFGPEPDLCHTSEQKRIADSALIMLAGAAARVKLVDDTFVNANTGELVELHGMSWVSMLHY